MANEHVIIWNFAAVTADCKWSKYTYMYYILKTWAWGLGVPMKWEFHTVSKQMKLSMHQMTDWQAARAHCWNVTQTWQVRVSHMLHHHVNVLCMTPTYTVPEACFEFQITFQLFHHQYSVQWSFLWQFSQHYGSFLHSWSFFTCSCKYTYFSNSV